ncbi:MAG: ATP-binding protein [Fuerstiella sp.]|jgi:serine/threonine-protein kinase RsbW|nr:ATP-binding protein [Fuerstiella sp.]MDG2130250.1 ATP-binding protein [Fuerstiella sp.]
MPAASQLNVQIPSDTTEGLAVQEQIIALMEKHEYSMRDIFAMRLSLEEGITNAIKHGNGNDLEKKVTVFADVSDEKLRVEVTDEGEGFVPEAVPDPTDDNFIERACGRGLMLMRAYLNFVEYSEGGTRLTMERERNSELPIIEDDD